MLDALASPSVCVIDDDEEDYTAILSALNSCFISTVHLIGSVESLPPKPFERLQLVFLDLHLSGSIGKDAASYTANYFRKTVAPSTAPLVVVIWSKYAADVPNGEGETEAELFKRTLLEASPDYAGRLIFVEMAKPKLEDRPGDWETVLKAEIENALTGLPAITVMWTWNELVKDGCAKISQDLTLTAQAAIAGSNNSLEEGLKATLQKLAKAQSEGDFDKETAPKYLVSLLSQLLLDQLENPVSVSAIAEHGDWLSADAAIAVPPGFPTRMNGLLLTSEHSTAGSNYSPGTVFRITSPAGFSAVFGKNVDDMLEMWMGHAKQGWQNWLKEAEPVLIELSPVCDLAQGNRVNALLVGGVVVPASMSATINKSGDAFGKIAVNFYLRWPGENFAEQEVALAFCNRYKATVPAGQMVDWLKPWFRIRDLPVASIRNANAAHASRVGYASIT